MLKSLNRTLEIYLIATLILISPLFVNAQKYSPRGINIGLQGGISKTLTEVPNGFKETISEFNNKPGFTYSLEFSRYFSSRFEIAAAYSNIVLKGVAYNPDFSAEGIQHGLPDDIIDPVEYKSKMYGGSLYFRYYFLPQAKESGFNPYLKAGTGLFYYISKLKYIDAAEDDVLFGKGIPGQTNLVTPSFFLGTGFKTNLSPDFYMLSSIDINMVNYDFLDVVHNYNPGGGRMEVIGLYTEIKVGIFYNLHKGKKQGKGKSASKPRKSTKPPYLPFR